MSQSLFENFCLKNFNLVMMIVFLDQPSGAATNTTPFSAIFCDLSASFDSKLFILCVFC